MKNKLTEKQKAFCLEYLVDKNAAQAAIRAGYSKHTAKSQGQRLLTKVVVLDYLKKKQKNQEIRTGITADYVLNSLKQIADNCKVENPSAANRSLELLGRHLKLFTDLFEAKLDHGLHDEFANQSDAEFMKTLRARGFN